MDFLAYLYSNSDDFERHIVVRVCDLILFYILILMYITVTHYTRIIETKFHTCNKKTHNRNAKYIMAV